MEIYFDDLTVEAQERLMTEAGIKDPAEANWDVLPICEFEVNPEE